MPVQKSQRDSSPPLFLTLSLVLVTQNLASNTALSSKLVYYFWSFDSQGIGQAVVRVTTSQLLEKTSNRVEVDVLLVLMESSPLLTRQRPRQGTYKWILCLHRKQKGRRREDPELYQLSCIAETSPYLSYLQKTQGRRQSRKTKPGIGVIGDWQSNLIDI